MQVREDVNAPVIRPKQWLTRSRLAFCFCCPHSDTATYGARRDVLSAVGKSAGTAIVTLQVARCSDIFHSVFNTAKRLQFGDEIRAGFWSEIRARTPIENPIRSRPFFCPGNDLGNPVSTVSSIVQRLRLLGLSTKRNSPLGQGDWVMLLQ
jgi:hypothetical protein